jgi:hypothetical protein
MEALDEMAKNFKAERISFDHRLVEEAYQIQETALPLDSIKNSFTVIKNPKGFTEIIAKRKIGNNEVPVLISRDAQSSTGWKFHHAPDTILHELTEMGNFASFYFEEELYVFSIAKFRGFAGYLVPFKRDKTGTWTSLIHNQDFAEACKMPLSHHLETGYTADGQPYVAGLFRNFANPILNLGLFYRHPKTKKWIFKYYPIGGEKSLINTLRVKIDATQVECTACIVVEGHLLQFVFTGNHETGPIKNTNRVDLKLKTQQGSIYGMEAREDVLKPDFFMRGNNNILVYYFMNASNQYESIRLTGGIGLPENVNEIRYTEANGQAFILALDAHFQLWKLKLSDRSNNRFNTLKWILLGDKLRKIANAPGLTGEMELFAVSFDSKHSVEHMYQSKDGTWYRETISEPAPINQTVVKLSAYVVEIACTTKAGIPSPKTAVEIAANRYTEIISEGVSYHVDHQYKQTLLTNENGKLRFAVKAASIKAPAFKVYVAGVMGGQGITVRPDIHSFEKLASAATTGEELKARGMIDPKYNDKAGEVAKALQESSKLILKKSELKNAEEQLTVPEWKSNTPYLNGLELFSYQHHDNHQLKPDFSHNPKSFELFFGKSNDVVFTELSGMALTGYGANAISIEAGSWDSLGDFFRWVKNAVEKVVKFAVKIIGDTCEFLIDIGGKLYTAIVNTIHEIGNFIELIFERIAKDVAHAAKAVVNWLKELLGWEDILATKDVFVHFSNQFFIQLENNLDKGKEFIDKNFTQIDKNLREQMDKAIDMFEGNDRSIRQLAGNVEGNPQIGKDPLIPAVLSKQVAANTVRSGYTSSLSDTHYRNSKQTESFDQETLDIIEKLKALVDKFIKNDWPEIKEDAFKLIEHFKGFSEKPEAFFDLLLVGLLKVIKLVLSTAIKIAKNLIIAVLEIIKAVVTLIKKLLNTPLEIPVLSKLYSELTGSPLTTLDLICLSAAFPVTIIYKATSMGYLLKRGPAPFTKQEVIDLKNWQIPFPNIFGHPEEKITFAKPPVHETVLSAISAYVLLNKGPLDIVNATIKRIDNDGGWGVSNPFEKFSLLSSLLVGVLGTFLSGPYNDFPRFRTDNMSKLKVYAWLSNVVNLYLKALSGSGLKLPHLSDIQGIIGIITVPVHIVLVGMKIERKENVFSVVNSCISSFPPILPFTISSSKVDHSFIVFGSGLALGALCNSGTLATRIGDIIIRHQQFSEA